MRCDYCVYRNGWECGDGYRISNDIMCENFKLDFEALPNKTKELIQKKLMLEDT